MAWILDFFLSQAQEIHKTRDFRELSSFSIYQSSLKSLIFGFSSTKKNQITGFQRSLQDSRQSAVGEITYISGTVSSLKDFGSLRSGHGRESSIILVSNRHPKTSLSLSVRTRSKNRPPKNPTTEVRP